MGQISFPEMYERWLVGPLFRPWAELILSEVSLSPGRKVLDIACGTGIVARIAQERLGNSKSVVGIDINPDMLAIARSIAPDIDWRVGNASALPLGEGEQFDVVVCQQGFQFFPDKKAAIAGMRRALTKGGQLAIATWSFDEEMPLLLELRHIAERHVGPVVDQRYSFGEAGLLEELLRDGGFVEVRVKKKSLTIQFEDGEPFLRLNAMALVGMSSGGKTMGDQQRRGVVDAIVNDSIAMTGNGSKLVFDISANLATANG